MATINIKIENPNQVFNVLTQTSAGNTYKLTGGKSKNSPSLVLAFTNALRTAQSDGAGTSAFGLIADGTKNNNGDISFSFEGRTVIVGKKLFGFAQRLFTTTPADGQLFEVGAVWTAYAQANAPGIPPTPPTPPTFALSSSAATVNEGSSVIFTLTTTKVAAGTIYSYVISGVSASDITGGNLTGMVTIDANGVALIPISVVADATTEVGETIVLTVAGQSASVLVVDVVPPPTPPTPPTPQAFTLTTDKFSYIGGAANDTFVGGLNAAGQQTLLPQDTIDGGGGINSLIATVVQNVTPAQIRNVQNIDLTFQGINNPDVNLSNATGVATVANTGSIANAFIRGLSTATAIRHLNTGTNLALQFLGVTGSSDSAALTLSGITAGALTLNGIETLNLTSSGSAANVLTSLTDAALTTLNLGGTAGLTINNALAAVTTVAQPVGGATSGALNLTFTQGAVTATGGSGNDTFTVNGAGNANLSGGLGNDTFVFGAGFFTAADTVSGGDGTTDTLQVDAAGTAVANTNITGVEILAVSGAVGAALNTGGITSGINTVNLLGGTGVASTVTGPAGTLSLNLGSSTTVGLLAGQLDVNDTGVATTDVLNLSNSNAASNAYAGRALVIGGYETVNLATGSGSTAQTTGVITLTPDGVGTGVLNISGANGITTGAITATTINASGLTGTSALVMSGVTQTATSITGTANADTLIASAAGTLIEAGAGTDSIVGAAGNDTLRGAAGNDTITAGTGNDTIDGGEGNDRILLAGNLTAADTVDGGAGTNTAVITAAVATAAIGARLSNIQTLETSAVAQDMSVFGNTTITTIAQSGAALAVTNAGATLNTFNVVDPLANPSATPPVLPTAVQINSSFRRATDTATNALTVNANRAVLAGSTLAVNDEETVTVAAAGNNVDLDLTNAGDLTTLNITASGSAAQNLVIDALGATNLASASFSGINSLSTLNLNAATSAVNFTATVGSFASTVTGGTGADSLTGGVLNDSLTGNNGADTISGGGGNDTLVGGQGVDQISDGTGIDSVTAGTGADIVTLSVDATADRITQGTVDSVASTGSNVTVTLQAGDTLTYANGVDLINGFLAGATNGDVLLIDSVIAQSILGQTSAGLTSTGYLSGNYNTATGVFTVTANGVGADTMIVQIGGGGNITTNTSSVILRGVNSAKLVNSNFGGSNTANIVPLYGTAGANIFSFLANSFATARIFIAADGTITPATQNITPNPATGFSQALMVQADFNNLLGGNGVTFNVAGATSTALTSVRGSSGDDVIIEATEDFGANDSTVNGGAGIDTLTITTFAGNASYGSTAAADGQDIFGIENISLTAGTGANSLTLENTVTVVNNGSVVAISNSGAASAATVILGSGAAHSFTTASSGIQTITVGQNAQNVTTGAGADDIIVTTTGLALTGNLNAGTAANTLTVTLADTETVNFTGATLTGTQSLIVTSNAPVITIDEANLAAFTTAITGGAGVETLTLTSTGNGVFNFSNTAMTAVNVVTITNGGSNVTFQALDVGGLATLTGSAAGITTVNFTNTTDISADAVTQVDVVTIAGVDQTLTLANNDFATAGLFTTITGSGTSNLALAATAAAANFSFVDTSITGFDTIDITLGVAANTLTIDSESIVGNTTLVADAGANLALGTGGNFSNITLTAADFDSLLTTSATAATVSNGMFAGAVVLVDSLTNAADTALTIAMSSATLNLGAIAFGTTNGVDTTITGTAGNDTITFADAKAVGSAMVVTGNGGNDTFRFEENSGNSFVAGGGDFVAAIADAVTITDFAAAGDQITGLAGALSGVNQTSGAVAAGTWNLDTTGPGFALITGASLNDFSSAVGVYAAVGNVTATDTDIAYFALQNTAGTQVGVYVVDFNGANTTAPLAAADDVSLIAVINITAGTFSATNLGLF